MNKLLILLFSLFFLVLFWTCSERVFSPSEPEENPLNASTQLPSPPANLVLKILSSQSAEVSWMTSASAEGYLLYYSQGTGKPLRAQWSLPPDQTQLQLSGLLADELLTVWVEAWNRSGTSAAVSVQKVPGLPPAAPSNLIVTRIGSNAADLNWIDKATNESGYNVLIFTNSVLVSSISFSSGTTNASLTNLPAYTDLLIQVIASNIYEQNLIETHFTAGAAPAAPQIISLSAMLSGMNIIWTNLSANAAGYRIYWSTNTQQGKFTAAQTGGITNSAFVPDLFEGRMHWFWVEAYNSITNSLSAFSNAYMPMRPAAPNSLTAARTGETGINLFWADAASNETGYLISISSNGKKPAAASFSLAAQSTNYSLVLTPYILWSIWVEASNSIGRSGAVSTNIYPGIVPAAAAAASSAVNGVTVNLKWNDNSSNESGFDIFWNTSAVKPASAQVRAPMNATNYNVTMPSSLTPYWYWIEAVNGVGPAVSTADTTATTGILAPEIVDIFISFPDCWMKFYWLDITGETGYRIYISNAAVKPTAAYGTVGAGGTFWQAPLTTNFAEGAQYYIWIEAYQGTNTGSSMTMFTVPIKPNAPSGLTVTSITDDIAQLSWTDLSSDEAGFNIWWSTNGVISAAPQATAAANATTFTAGPLLPGTSYKFFVASAMGPFISTKISNQAVTTGTPLTLVSAGKTASALTIENAGTAAAYVNDGNYGTRWASLAADNQWVQIDLASVRSIKKIILSWEPAYASSYEIQASTDGTNFAAIYTNAAGDGGIDILPLTYSARYFRMFGLTRATTYGFSLWEFEIYE